MNLLIVKLSSIGDVIHTLPSLAALRKAFPNAHISWVIEEASAPIVKGNPYLDNLIVSRRKTWNENLKKGVRIRETFQEIKFFIKQLRQRPYDIVIDFNGLLKSAILVLLSGARRKIGYNSLQELSGLFYNEKIFENMDKHAVDRYLDFVRHLGAACDNPEFYLPISEADKKNVDVLLSTAGISGDKKFVAISPMSFAGETRLWYEDRYAVLADRIIEELKTEVVFTGSRSGGMIDRIQSMMTNKTLNLEGKTSLLELAHLYERAELLITPDSGPMHIAAAVGTPVIALFGASAYWRTGPYGKGHKIISANLPCSPCFLKKCSKKKCMQDISTDHVFAAVERVLTNGAK
jgi:3-deoxy-D-manno-octulosonic-acid transferase/heptosyltransferase-1